MYELISLYCSIQHFYSFSLVSYLTAFCTKSSLTLTFLTRKAGNFVQRSCKVKYFMHNLSTEHRQAQVCYR